MDVTDARFRCEQVVREKPKRRCGRKAWPYPFLGKLCPEHHERVVEALSRMWGIK